MNTVGIYLHIPFCKQKCPYCDFYSLTDQSLIDSYVNALVKSIHFYKDKNKTVDTIYFGGGTPTLLAPEHIEKILESIYDCFNIVSSETTIEANPCTVTKEYLSSIKSIGVNRLSFGVQSLNDNELTSLNRLHSSQGAVNAILTAQQVGFNNISADLMVGIPNQTSVSLLNSIDILSKLDVQHISSYILKVEKGTRFFEIYDTLNLPCEDEVADRYLFMVDELGKRGYEQYEISNFSKPYYESKHNLKYWQLDEYLGLGAAAHSFYNGRRFFFERDIKEFLEMADKGVFEPTSDCEVNLKEEYIMLSLRLTKGLSLKQANALGIDTDKLIKDTDIFVKNDFMKLDGDRLHFTKQGFLVSNTILSKII